MWVLTVPALADNVGDWYDNRDNGHAAVGLGDHPGVTAMSSGYGIQTRVVADKVVVGNASLAHPGSTWSSLVRMAFMRAFFVRRFYDQYTGNNAYWYPEHRDHDATDHYHAMTPAVKRS